MIKIKKTTSSKTLYALYFAVLFLAVLLIAVLLGGLHAYIVLAYLGASLITMAVYVWDKSAARNNRQRTPERTLHLLCLLCGWPGAIVAQHYFRHKSKKIEFLVVFWITVIINCAALVWLFTPFGNILMGG